MVKNKTKTKELDKIEIHEGGKGMEKNKCDQLMIITAPLVEFLKENFNPHCRIVIDFDGARVVEDVLGVPYKEKAHSTEE